MATSRSHFPQLQGVMIMISSFENHNNYNDKQPSMTAHYKYNNNYKGHRLRVRPKAPRQLADHDHLDHDHESESER